MIRISLSKRPEAWHEIEIIWEGEPQPMRVRYWLLDTDEAAQWAAHRLALAKAVRTNDETATFDMLIDDLSPEQVKTVRNLLIERIVDWDLADADADGDKLDVNPGTVGAVLKKAMFWRPMFQGLLDASGGVAAKKTEATG